MPDSLLVLVTGDPVPDVKRTHGGFDRMIGAFLGSAATLRVVDARLGPLPSWSQEVPVIVTGSPASVTEQTTWMVLLEDWLRGAHEESVAILGICFGHQALARALGGRVGRNPRGREMGTVKIELLRQDPLFHGFPESFPANTSHVDTVIEPPDGAVSLAASQKEPYHCLKFGPRSYGVQFHPEFDGAIMQGYIDERRDHLEREGCDPDRLDAVDTPRSAAILRRFVAIAREEGTCGRPCQEDPCTSQESPVRGKCRHTSGQLQP